MTVLSGAEFKKRSPGPWYKWLNREMLHNGFVYKMGLNRDFRPFNPKVNTNGLYLARHLKYLINFRKYGPNIGIFDIPNNARVFVDNEEKIRADMITLLKVVSSEDDILEILKKSLEDATGPVEELCFYGLRNGYFKILNWASERNFLISLEDMSTYVIRRGVIVSIEWLKDRGLVLTPIMCKHASRRGQREMLKWLLTKRCPWNSKDCYNECVHFREWETLNWILANRKNFSELDEYSLEK